MNVGSDEVAGGGPDRQVREVVGAVVEAVRRTGLVSAGALVSAVDMPLRAMARRVAAEGVSDPRPVADPARLASELRRRHRSVAVGGSAAVVAGRAARRFGPLRFLARRGPTWFLAAGVPALYSSVTRGTEEIRLVASHLALRVRATGAEADPDRVANATVQVLTGRPVDPDLEPDHARLVSAWLRRAMRATLPMASAVSTRDPDGVADRAASVDPSSLAVRTVLPVSSRAVGNKLPPAASGTGAGVGPPGHPPEAAPENGGRRNSV